MTVTIAPRWAFSGLALHDDITGWLSGGVDLRILVSPALGFPLHPFLIYPLGEIETERLGHSSWAIEDEHGDPVAGPPFAVARDAPLYATLVNPDVASPFAWVEGAGDLTVDVVVDGPSGPTAVMTRSKPPWQLGGCRITRLRISGNGQVDDVVALWGRISDPAVGPVLVGLPVTRAARYQGLSDAAVRADLRVGDLQPRRVSLVDDPNDPPAIGVDEPARVNIARDELDDWFIRVVDDPSAVVADAAVVHRGPGPARAKPWTTTTDPVASLLTAAWDRGLARWLGLHWTDDTPLPNPVPPYWIYAITGLWAIDPDRRIHSPRFPGDDPPRMVDRLPVSADPAEMQRIIDAVPGLDALVSQLPIGQVLLPLTAVVGAAVGATPDLPSAPALAGARQGPWRRRVDQRSAQRTVALEFATPPPGSVALARRDPQSGALIPLGRQYRDAQPWRAPYAVGRPTDGSLSLEIWDHDAPVDASEYLVARSDAMGRWSAWASIVGPDVVRPAVPVPRVAVTVPSPAAPPPVHDDPIAVLLRVDVAVPSDEEIEPGGFGVRRVGITADSEPEQWFDLPDPQVASFAVDSVHGPQLGRAEGATTRVRARFEDAAQRHSTLSDAVERTVRDPRPPHHVTLTGPLHYAGRPGRDGLARALLEWGARSDLSYRVYLAYEPELRARLSGGGGQDIVDALDAAAGSGERAAVWFANRGRLPQAAFHPVGHTQTPPGDTRCRHVQELPGGLPGLAIFKVIPLSAALVEADWAGGATAIYAVPDDRPPATPLLAVRAVANGVEATITVGRGSRPLARWRLRRRRSSAGPAVFMPIVAEGTVGPAAADAAPAPVVIVDPLLAPADSVDRWIYVAEVQGADEDASVEPRQRSTPWSPPSRQADVVLVPDNVPPPVSSATAVRSAIDPAIVEIRVTHDGRLVSDLAQPYRIEAYRMEPGTPEPELAAQLPANAPEGAGGRAPDGSGSFVLADAAATAATVYVVVVIDPIGRSSTPTTVPVTP